MSWNKPNVAGLKRGISDSTKPKRDWAWAEKHNADNAARDALLIKIYKERKAG